MAKRNEGGSFAWFVAGMTVGIAATILLAPQSGEEMRRSLADAAARGREFADRKRREATDMGRDVMDQGREFAGSAKQAGREAVDKSKEALEKGKKALADLTPKKNGKSEV